MKDLFNHIHPQMAIVVLNELSSRLQGHTRHSYLYRGSEGNSLRAQAQQNLRWHQLFCAMNRREPA
ncbi:hypothetical protein C2855_15850 [Aeromonas bestiarum]|uniref:hypothetical protein n=1 Tax=Aeromonas bestiarum TaxID=105751 RepID=UPI000CD44F56|nr:hypothetical protein [Aeromonas bestiarum]POG22399.1 hypothetical protein C2855_15850 [Aeromonas bestiarum]